MLNYPELNSTTELLFQTLRCWKALDPFLLFVFRFMKLYTMRVSLNHSNACWKEPYIPRKG